MYCAIIYIYSVKIKVITYNPNLKDIKRHLSNCLIAVGMMLITIACQKKGEVTLQLHNKEIHYVVLEDMQRRYVNEERQRSETIMNYTLKNTTDKKLLFVFDKKELAPSLGISPDTSFYGYMGFTIADHTDKIRKFWVISPLWAENGDLQGCELYQLQKMQNFYLKQGIESKDAQLIDDFINNSIVLYPGETRTFKTILSLPLIWEIDRRTETPLLRYYDLKETDNFQLFYFCKAAEMKSRLPKYLKDELDRNEIEIFDGKLEAAPIKLKKK